MGTVDAEGDLDNFLGRLGGKLYKLYTDRSKLN
jgi:hypothetical protein